MVSANPVRRSIPERFATTDQIDRSDEQSMRLCHLSAQGDVILTCLSRSSTILIIAAALGVEVFILAVIFVGMALGHEERRKDDEEHG